MNPFLSEFKTPFNSVPFDKLRTVHFAPAFDKAFAEARVKIENIKNNETPPDFRNTIEALENAAENVGNVARVLFNLNHAETSKELQELVKIIAPKLTEFQNDITLDPLLFHRVKIVFEEADADQLTIEQNKLLENTYKNFVRNGANLDDNHKNEFRKITSELAVLSVQFTENVLAETNNYMLHITSQENLAGLPPHVISAAAEEANKRKSTGWVFTLHAPSFIPFMKYADNRELRKQMFLAYNLRGYNGNKNDNSEIIKKMAQLRLQQAKMLGYNTFSDFTLEDRMAKSTQKVMDFLDELRASYYPKAKTEVAEVTAYAKSLGADFQLQRWDWNYYSEKLKEQKYAITDETFRPFFELGHVKNSIFDLANRLYGISFRPNNAIPVYHKQVEVYEVYDTNDDFLALIYLDFFTRESKSGGAWMTEFAQQHKNDGENIRPHVSLVFNFTPPANDRPSLLTYMELRTFLHEFGHALHGIFSNVTYESLAGTEVYRDFVELPSQIMENWADKKEWLDSFALHYKTGERIPEELLNKLIESRNYNIAFFGCRQLAFGYIDMAWHTLTEPFNEAIDHFEKNSVRHLELLPPVEGTLVSTSFSHIFGGGYAAGYYSYKWSEVLEADAFELFEENGIFDKPTAKRFRECILAKGGTEHPIKLYIDFRGREPSTEALLRRSGLK